MIDDVQGESVLGRVISRSARSPKPFKNSVFTMAINYPIVPKDEERLCVMISATHSTEDLDFAMKVIEEVGKEVGDLSLPDIIHRHHRRMNEMPNHAIKVSQKLQVRSCR